MYAFVVLLIPVSQTCAYLTLATVALVSGDVRCFCRQRSVIRVLLQHITGRQAGRQTLLCTRSDVHVTHIAPALSRVVVQVAMNQGRRMRIAPPTRRNRQECIAVEANVLFSAVARLPLKYYSNVNRSFRRLRYRVARPGSLDIVLPRGVTTRTPRDQRWRLP